MGKTSCFDCGKKIDIYESDSIIIPRPRCDDCLEDLKRLK